ncbi:MAG: hypothetical protein K6F05_02655 [Succinivibrio sp.]|nr:hypothetical protein [Succinivibrio sp.]
MKKSPHALHRSIALSRNHRRRFFLKSQREHRQARHTVFFNQQQELRA